ncbi:MAG: LysM peptidoglycan-binding domain-containing protein [Bacteroidetes bacterium]|nr:LysM peptidoglycan-binding domain-containing protein [Bacteroidota bacterium]
MMKTRQTYFLVLGIYLLTSFTVQANRISYQEYIDRYKDIAMQEMKTHRIPASITLAQGLLESGSGNSRLAVEGNNHFGIKCKKNWTGGTIIEDDDEQGECFRAYSSAYESYLDHSLFLKNNPRYNFLFELPILDYKAWAEGLRQAGYATNQKYPQLLVNLIERYSLAKFDTIVFYGEQNVNYFTEPVFKANIHIVDNGVPLTVARPGQTVHSIAEDNNMRDWQIYKYNDLPKDARIDPGMIIYLKPKRNKASVSNHKVEPGETMWEISQKYGIKLKKLYKKNRMEPGTEVKPGEVINMRRKRKVIPDTGRISVEPISDVVDTTPTKPRKVEIAVPPQPIHNELQNSDTISQNPNENFTNNNNNSLFYTVSQGETLYSISKRLNISIDSLVKWNNLKDNSLTVGQRIYYNQPPKIQINSLPNKLINHTIQTGETLYSISRIYGVTVDEIKRWNQIVGNEIRVGQVIKIEDRR